MRVGGARVKRSGESGTADTRRNTIYREQVVFCGAPIAVGGSDRKTDRRDGSGRREAACT